MRAGHSQWRWRR